MRLPKHESILQWAYLHPDSLINYPWEHYHDYTKSNGWNIKYRNNSPYNGRKPIWRKHRKQEKQFIELQRIITLTNHNNLHKGVGYSSIINIENCQLTHIRNVNKNSYLLHMLYVIQVD